MAKKHTILLIPECTHKDVKRLILPRWLAPMALALALVAGGLAGYWFNKYNQACQNLPQMAVLKERNQYQETRLKNFAIRLEALKHQVGRIQEFNQKLRKMANLAPAKQDNPIFGVGGLENSRAGVGVRLATTAKDRFFARMQRDMDQLQSASLAELEIQRELAKFLTERRSLLAATPSIWPVKGWVTSGFGYRRSPFTGKRSFHAGLDISTRTGTVIVAPADGVVTFVGWEGGYGRIVAVNHGHGIVTRYAHLRKALVKTGQKISRGQKIGQVGSSGRSSGPHLHYEVLLSGVPTNPKYYILD